MKQWNKLFLHPYYDLANDMPEMLELFEDKSKSEFYYFEDTDGWNYEII